MPIISVRCSFRLIVESNYIQSIDQGRFRECLHDHPAVACDPSRSCEQVGDEIENSQAITLSLSGAQATRRRMRILHVIAGIAPRYGGPSRAVLEMTEALRRAGVQTLIATTDADGSARLNVPLGVETTYLGAPIVFFPRQWSEAFKVSLPLASWLDAHVPDFDVVHIHAVFNHACITAALACQRLGVPYVVRPLGTLDRWSLHQKPLRKWLFWQLAGRRMLRGAAAVHYTTPDEQRQVEAALGVQRGRVIPLGVADECGSDAAVAAGFRTAHPSLGDAPYVLALSRLHPVKALDILLDAFLDATEDPACANWHLVIAGQGEAAYAAALRAQADQRRGAERVLFPGWLEGNARAGALAGAGLLVLASRHENFGLSIAEAFMHHVPALVSSNVMLAETIRKAGAGWVATLDRAALAAALALALSDSEERQRRGLAGRQLALERFSWTRLAEELTTLYRSVESREGYAIAARVLS